MVRSRALKLARKTLLALMLLVARANAFSLLGPYTDWMQTTNGYRQPFYDSQYFSSGAYGSDIGGPMNLARNTVGMCPW